MAVVRTMISVAREEAAVITTEIATTARVTAVENVASSSKLVGETMNPLAIRQAAEVAARDAMGESSLLASHLSLAPKSSSTSMTQSLLSGVVKPPEMEIGAGAGAIRSVLAESVEADLGISLRTAMNNATQTGVEENLGEAVDVAKVLSQSGEGISVQEAVAEVRASVTA